MGSSGLRILDAGLEDGSSLTGRVFFIHMHFLTGLERDYSSISEAVYVGTISTCSAAVASSDFVFLERLLEDGVQMFIQIDRAGPYAI